MEWYRGTQYQRPRKTCTVAYATQMVSRVAVIAGALHQGSVRSVPSLICARLLAGATVVSVILDVSALNPGLLVRPSSPLGSPGASRHFPAARSRAAVEP